MCGRLNHVRAIAEVFRDLHASDGLSKVEALGATVHDGVTASQLVLVVEVVNSFQCIIISAAISTCLSFRIQ